MQKNLEQARLVVRQSSRRFVPTADHLFIVGMSVAAVVVGAATNGFTI